MHDAIIGELGRIGALDVIARHSAMLYKGTRKSAPEIARELKVDGVVEGPVLRAGGRVRITSTSTVDRSIGYTTGSNVHLF